jgi:hypothetical protein
MQDKLAAYALAMLLCPIVPVTAASGTFKVFDDRNDFLPEDMKRGIGGTRKRLGFDATDDTYACTPYGVEIPVDDFETDLAGGQNPVANDLLAQGKMRSMLSRKATGYAKRVVDFVFANLTPVANRGNFTNPDIDPIDQLDEQLDSIATIAGTTENFNLVLSTATWLKIRQNAKVKARLGITGGLTLTREQLIGGLLFPVNLVISAVSYSGTKRGQTASSAKTNILGDYALITHSLPNPTLYDPSPFKCFSTSSVLVDSVKTYRDEPANSDVHAMDWSECIKKTGGACASLLAIS